MKYSHLLLGFDNSFLTTNYTCEECDFTCKTCNNTAKLCLSCKGNRV